MAEIEQEEDSITCIACGNHIFDAPLTVMIADRNVLKRALEILSKRLSGETFNHEGHAKEMRKSALAQARAELSKEKK